MIRKILLFFCGILLVLSAFAQDKGPSKSASRAAEPKAGEAGKANQVLDAARTAKGSLEKLKGARDVTITASVATVIQGQPMDLAIVSYLLPPGRTRQEINIPAYSVSITQALNGSSGWIDSPQGSQEMPEAMVESSQRGQLREWFINFLVAPPGTEFEISSLPDATVNGKSADVLSVKIGKEQFVMYLDKTTHLAVKSTYETVNAQLEKVNGESLYEDYKEVGGIKFSHKSTSFHNGEKFAEIKVSDIKVNTGLDEAKFKK